MDHSLSYDLLVNSFAFSVQLISSKKIAKILETIKIRHLHTIRFIGQLHHPKITTKSSTQRSKNSQNCQKKTFFRGAHREEFFF